MKTSLKEMISVDQAMIIAFRIHDRCDCGLLRAILAGFELRYQINWLSALGIGRKEFEEMIGKPRDVLTDWK